MDKLEAYLEQLGFIPELDKFTKLKYIYITDKMKQEYPFTFLSDDFKVSEKCKRTQTTKIYLLEMYNTMKSKKRLTTTTKSNMFLLIPFFEAIGKLAISDDFEVYNDRGLFRSEDKFVFRLVKNLESIFPGIEKKISTQHHIHSIRKSFVLDLCINVSETTFIGIEYDEKHHFDTDKTISDNIKRNILSRYVELRIFKVGDNFQNFLKSICYDVIKYHDWSSLENLRTTYITNLIAYNMGISEDQHKKIKNQNDELEQINKNNKKQTRQKIVETVIQIMKRDVISIQDLTVYVLRLNIKDIAEVEKSLKQMIKQLLIPKTGVKIKLGTKKITAIDKNILINFLMLYQDPVTNIHRSIFSTVVQEYLNVLNGSYDTYRYSCTNDDYNASLKTYLLAFFNSDGVDLNLNKKKSTKQNNTESIVYDNDSSNSDNAESEEDEEENLDEDIDELDD